MYTVFNYMYFSDVGTCQRCIMYTYNKKIARSGNWFMYHQRRASDNNTSVISSRVTGLCLRETPRQWRL